MPNQKTGWLKTTWIIRILTRIGHNRLIWALFMKEMHWVIFNAKTQKIALYRLLVLDLTSIYANFLHLKLGRFTFTLLQWFLKRCSKVFGKIGKNPSVEIILRHYFHGICCLWSSICFMTTNSAVMIIHPLWIVNISIQGWESPAELHQFTAAGNHSCKSWKCCEK